MREILFSYENEIDAYKKEEEHKTPVRIVKRMKWRKRRAEQRFMSESSDSDIVIRDGKGGER